MRPSEFELLVLGDLVVIKERHRRQLTLRKSCGTVIAKRDEYPPALKVKLHSRFTDESEWYDPTWFIPQRCECLLDDLDEKEKAAAPKRVKR